MATLEIWDYGISHGGKDDKAVGPRPNDGTFQVCKTWLVFFLAEVEDRGRVFVVWNLNSEKWTSLGECWIWYDMGHGISLGFETPKSSIIPIVPGVLY